MNVGERYVLGRLVGEGATACVYEAHDTTLRREVAVKVFRDADLGANASSRISEEVRILTSLSHRYLLPLYDAGRNADGQSFIVTPLIRGTTLARLVARGPVTPREVKRIGKALAEALTHIHALGVVHRDIKPSNVLLAVDGTPYLADFGFAHADDGPALTATNCVVGTAGYLAPEQAEGLAATPASDVYALGLVLLEALTGERAYHGTPLERAVANALRPPTIPARLGPGWLDVLRAMTARDPVERPTAYEARDLLGIGEDELPEVTALDATMELTPVLGDAPGGPAFEVPGVAAVPAIAAATAPPAADSASVGLARVGHASGATPTAGSPVAPAERRIRTLTRTRLATAGAAALAATAVLGLGAGTNWLSPGAAATHQPPAAPTTPGAGATGPQRTTATSPSPSAMPPSSDPSAAPASDPSHSSNPPVSSKPTSSNPPQPADVLLSNPVKCHSDHGGHGKRKC